MTLSPETPGATASATCEAAHPLGAAFGVLAAWWRLPEADVGPLGPGFAPVAALFADDRFLDAMLARQRAATPGLDAKGAAAYLVTEYAGIVGLVAAVCLLHGGVVPSFDPARIALAFDAAAGGPSGQPRVRMRFLAASFATDRPEQADGLEAARTVDADGLREEARLGIEAHFHPLIERLHEKTGLPRQAMWRLVGDAVAARFLEAGRRFGCEEAGKADALAILKQPGSPLANPQMHFFDIVVREDDPPRRVLASRSFRARGGCCRYYTAPGGSLCSTCVLLDPVVRDSRLEARMRRQLGLR